MVLENFGLMDLGFIGVFFTLLITAIIYLAKRDEKMDAKKEEMAIQLSKVVENNTIAMTQFCELRKKCERK